MTKRAYKLINNDSMCLFSLCMYLVPYHGNVFSTHRSQVSDNLITLIISVSLIHASNGIILCSQVSFLEC